MFAFDAFARIIVSLKINDKLGKLEHIRMEK
jgi:hypothetical protein